MKSVLWAVAFFATSLSSMGRVNAGMFTVTGYNSQGVAGFADGNSVTEYGGANSALINGSPASDLYCVEAFTNISVSPEYAAGFTHNGFVHGQLVGNANEVAYLLANYSHTNAVQSDLTLQNALQASIWHLTSPALGHTWDMDSNAAGYSNYLGYLADASGHSNYDLSHTLWISPYNTDGSPAQGFAWAEPVPVPSNIVLLGVGGVSFLAVTYWRRRKCAL